MTCKYLLVQSQWAVDETQLLLAAAEWRSVLLLPAIRTWHKSERYQWDDECILSTFFFLHNTKDIWRISFFPYNESQWHPKQHWTNFHCMYKKKKRDFLNVLFLGSTEVDNRVSNWWQFKIDTFNHHYLCLESRWTIGVQHLGAGLLQIPATSLQSFHAFRPSLQTQSKQLLHLHQESIYVKMLLYYPCVPPYFESEKKHTDTFRYFTASWAFQPCAWRAVWHSSTVTPCTASCTYRNTQSVISKYHDINE